MTVKDAALLLLITSTLSICLAVFSVVRCSKLASRFIELRRWVRSQITTPPSDAKLNALLADQVALSSALQSVGKTVKRMSSRSGMDELRAERKNGPPPLGNKAAAKAYYLNGKTNAEIHRLHQPDETED